jgi:arylsulfatase A-like enzyme
MSDTTNRPNVVIIMADQQPASSLPIYGNPVVRMPNLAAFAGSGRVFDNAITSCPLCVPARVSMFTGQYPSSHGSLNNQILMGPDKNHMLRLLSAHGYRTGLAGKNHCFTKPDLALFDSVAECGHYGPVHDNGRPVAPEYAEPTRYLRECADLKSAWGHTVNPYPPETLGTAWTTDRANDFVRESAAGSQPFFLWFSIADPHIPFQVSEPYASMYPLESVDLPPLPANEMDGKPVAQRMDRAVMAGDAVDEVTIRRIRSIYYGMNSYIDDELGRFFKTMDQLELWDDTLVIYLADHGEYLGEHRMIRKSKAAYDCLVKIPFVVRAPERVASGEAGRSRAFVSLEDVMPTVLDSCGIDVPAEAQGRSLLPVLSGEGVGPSAAHPAFRDHAIGEYGVHLRPWQADREYEVCAGPLSMDFRPSMKVGGHGKMRYIRSGEWKLTVSVDDKNELYHLTVDPWELMNVYDDPENAGVIVDLMDRLLEDGMTTTLSWVSTEGVS